MFKEFLAALTQKLIAFLQTQPDFFTKSKTEREKMSEEIAVPTAFKEYMLQVDEKEFLEDLRKTMLFINHPKDKSLGQSAFFKALVQFFATDLARKIDLLDSSFYLMQKSERENFINQLIKQDSLLANSLKNILINQTYQQISESISNISNIVSKSPYVVVQSPREINPEVKKEIRTEIQKKHPLSFPVFQINKKLIGGLRIFENGTTEDHSWLSRVLKFTSIT